MSNKGKIFNDPIYGFITCPSDLIFSLIEHSDFQRLRRIKQLGLTDYIYPGATHTRFHHAIGAMHLMSMALDVISRKGQMIMEVEREAAQIAILLHDIGHGPFSHVLENSFFKNTSHEELTLAIMEKLNAEFNGQLTLAIEMFQGKYQRAFFNQLISSQLDMDRLDYLKRDSFYTGVIEGQIGVDRIIEMLNVVNNQLVIEEKGLLSVENFLNSRKIMYWQVYLHKTALAVEIMLKKVFDRVRFLLKKNLEISISNNLNYFLIQEIYLKNNQNPITIPAFLSLDDHEIWYHLKKWVDNEDKILSFLCSGILNRNLFKISIRNDEIAETNKENCRIELLEMLANKKDLEFIFEEGKISNTTYNTQKSNISILMKNRTISEYSLASNQNLHTFNSNIIEKYYLCFANTLYLQKFSLENT